MFFKKKQKLVEQPLYYWEEKSYMLIIPKSADDNILKDSIERINKIKDLEISENNYSIKDNAMHLKIIYKNINYEVGLYLGEISVPEYYFNNNSLFTKKEKEDLLKATKSITVFMKFSEDYKLSYHLQLKLANALVPDMLGLMDESAEKIFSGKWVRMTAKSNVLPNPKDMFSVQAVVGENEKVWLHTHGLCRCGISELEILESDSNNYQNHYNLISTYALYLLDKREKYENLTEGAYIGVLINNQPVDVTSIPWTEALKNYKKLKLGGISDRQGGHNSKSNVIFLYKSEEDENNKIISKINVFDKFWGENPLFFISDEETNRMKSLAIERFNYVKEAFKDKTNEIIIKIGIPLAEKGKFEHIWFELLEIKNNKFKAKLTQEPYDIENMHPGYIAWFSIEDITDWLIYTKDFSVNPDNAYLLEK